MGKTLVSVAFAIEDFSALRYVRNVLNGTDFRQDIDIIADPDGPRDLLGMLRRFL
ncbi:hypothetical protein [Sinorhizobium meliloti]|uniref:hypothetical protein n=1 Tax=Rhizobium meliloti TaxID=382 RepID=UPI00398C912B